MPKWNALFAGIHLKRRLQCRRFPVRRRRRKNHRLYIKDYAFFPIWFITSIAGFLSLGIMGITMLIPPLNFLFVFIANLFLYLFGLAEFVRAYRNIKATKDKKTAEFVEKRQEDT